MRARSRSERTGAGTLARSGALSVLLLAAEPRRDVQPDSCAVTVKRALVEGERRLGPPAQRMPGQPPSPPRSAFFDFELDRAVTWLVGGPLDLGTQRRPPDVAMVQFIVDTAGRIVLPTTRVLSERPPNDARSRRRDSTAAVAAVRTWRARPAQIGGCVAPQLVQAYVRLE